MVSRQPAQDTISEPLVTTRLQLAKYEPEPWPLREYGVKQPPTTPSQWFSEKFPVQTQIYGCPFIEAVQEKGEGLSAITPLAPNIDFFAAILGGDASMGHKVIYFETDMQFYYYEPLQKLFKPTTEAKLGNLLRAYLMKCAEELPGNVHKLNLFLDFRSDKTIRAIVQRAKSILAADDTFFGVESKHQRQKGPEIHERMARIFAEQVLERQPGQILTLTNAYLIFTEYLKQKSMAPLRRGDFKSMFSPIIREMFDLGLRNDIMDPGSRHQTAGWKGIRRVQEEVSA